MKPVLTPSLTALMFTCTLGTAHAVGPDRVSDVSQGLSGWRIVDVRSGGVSQVTTSAADPFGGLGALEQTLPESPDRSLKTEVEIFSADTTLDPVRGLVPGQGGYGRLADLLEISVAWYRDSASTTWPWMGPAIRLYVYDPDLGVNGTSSIMVWEPVYNGHAAPPARAVPVDQWIESQLEEGRFWRQPLYLDGQRVPRNFCSLNPAECHRYVRLSEWGFGPNAVVFGFNIAVGSGWPGDYHGYVDHLAFQFACHAPVAWDFEPTVAANPSPTREARERRRRDRRRRNRRRR